jgi:murein DD-endopeptidase MepM/ murein hydrolase activator NlpD
MKFSFKILAIFLVFFAFSCRQKQIEIVDNSRKTYSRNSQFSEKKYRVFASSMKNQDDDKNDGEVKEEDLSSSKSQVKFLDDSNKKAGEQVAEKTSAQQITVAAGDTLFSISRQNGVNLRDLIEQNNLSAPYTLKTGQKLAIPQLQRNYHQVKEGETLYAISRQYGVKIDGLIEINNLHEPYSIKAGQKILVSKSADVKKPSYQLVSPDASKKPGEAQVAQVSENPGIKATISEKISQQFSHFSWPIKGEVISKFGPKNGGLYNDGINIKAKDGEAVKAAQEGVVAYVGNELRGYGNLVIVKHSSGWITAYAHLKEFAVRRGQKISKGEKIGLVGATGNVSSPQLYFGLRKGRDAVNPQNYLKS